MSKIAVIRDQYIAYWVAQTNQTTGAEKTEAKEHLRRLRAHTNWEN